VPPKKTLLWLCVQNRKAWHDSDIDSKKAHRNVLQSFLWAFSIQAYPSFSSPLRSTHTPPVSSDYLVFSVRIFTALQFILSKIGAVIAQFGRQFDENVML
jgi:hypothetical protein